MRLRTFTAPDMNRAMILIRETLGDDAVIISTARENGGKSVSVTAAIEEEWLQEEAEAAAAMPEPEETVPEHETPATHAAVLQDREKAYLLNEVEKILQFHSVPLVLTELMLRTVRDLPRAFPTTLDGVRDALIIMLDKLYRFAPIDTEHRAERLILIGPPGVGKTLAVAKIAANQVADKLPICVMTTDNKRAGGVEQLRAFASIMGLRTGVASSRIELRNLLKSCPEHVPVVIDAFGTNPYSYEELKELTEYATLHTVEPILVIPSGRDAQEAADVAQAYKFLGIRRLIISKADVSRRLGNILAAAHAEGLALANITTTSQVAGGFTPCNATTIARLMMQHKYD